MDLLVRKHVFNAISRWVATALFTVIALANLGAQENGAPTTDASKTKDSEAPEQPSSDSNEKPASEVEEKHWKFYWQDGLYYQLIGKIRIGGTNRLFKTRTEEKVGLSGKIGGMLQADAGVYWPKDSTANYENGVELRRARIYTDGEFYLHVPVHYKFQVGYDNPDWVLYDAYFWLQDIPWVRTFKFGYFKVPMSLSGYGSSRDLQMMERASAVDAFYPSHRTGLQIGGPTASKRINWNVGVFSVGQDVDRGDASDSQLRVVSRITGLPWYVDEEGKTPGLLHVGISGNYTFSSEGDLQYRSRPESHLAPYLVDTGSIDAQNAFLLGTEVAWVKGPWSIQSELIGTFVDTRSGNSGNFYGAYVDGSWFITGESRRYDRDSGLFTRTRPLRNLTFDGKGFGALELVAHASYVDLSYNSFRGGQMRILGGGLNWHINSFTKLQLNYQVADVKGGLTPGLVRIFQSRIQFAF